MVGVAAWALVAVLDPDVSAVAEALISDAPRAPPRKVEPTKAAPITALRTGFISGRSLPVAPERFGLGPMLENRHGGALRGSSGFAPTSRPWGTRFGTPGTGLEPAR